MDIKAFNEEYGIENWFEETFFHGRYSIKEIEDIVSIKFEKPIKAEDTTITDEPNGDRTDYRLTLALVGDEDEEYDEYYDVDIYYLKTRNKGEIYVTEINVDVY